MSVFFIGCPHLNHRNIAKFRKCVNSPEHNNALIVRQWEDTIHKNDLVFVMGDAAFDDEGLDLLGALRGRKILIKGNHDDTTSTAKQFQIFSEIHGMLKYKGMWLTHAPIHPDELRGKSNLHAHVHYASIQTRGIFGKYFKKEDPRYFNVCIDVTYPRTGSVFVSLDEARKRFNIT